MKKIILTGGGTAGHVTPILALLPELKRRFSEIHYIGRKDGIERELTENEGVIYHGIDCPRFTRGKFFVNLAVPFKLISAVRKARSLIKDIAPDVIFSKGGYVALPVALGAKKVPVVLHESDTSLGLANKLSARKAGVICSSFPLPKYHGKEVVHTGSPLRSRLYSGSRNAALAKCGFDGRRKVLLVTGGSLGAVAINNAVDANIEELTKRYDVIHLRGRGNGAEKRKGYYPIEFTREIYDLFAAADFAITRGGGNSVFELGALNVPMLIVPLPKGASRGDQIRNAEYFEKNGLALSLSQDNLGSELISSLETLEKKSPELIGNMRRYSFDGTREIIKVIENVIENKP